MGVFVHTEELSKRYGGTTVLENITLPVTAGSIVALIGPNGAGKSTLMKILLNFIQPSGGRATVFGCDSRRLGVEQLQRIGYVSEDQRMPEWMRADAFLDYCSAFYPSWKSEAPRFWAERFRLPLDRRIREMSRGMRAQLNVLAAIAAEPRLLLLDEPFGSVDVLVREELAEVILTSSPPEHGILLASHDLSDIQNFSTHVAYLDAGRLLFYEDTGLFLHRFRRITVLFEDSPTPPKGEIPRRWLNMKESKRVITFTDSDYNRERTDDLVREHFDSVKYVETHPMILREIFVELARASKARERL